MTDAIALVTAWASRSSVRGFCLHCPDPARDSPWVVLYDNGEVVYAGTLAESVKFLILQPAAP